GNRIDPKIFINKQAVILFTYFFNKLFHFPYNLFIVWEFLQEPVTLCTSFVPKAAKSLIYVSSSLNRLSGIILISIYLLFHNNSI
ncbi:MAG: hypothetical protein J7J87_04645, partial [Candidatus Diapherotrites archaeon]|nr:hypothetical protein [Candidatus Diapherotrites archaeon]